MLAVINPELIKLLPLLAKHLVYLSTEGRECTREHRIYETHRRRMHNIGLFLASGRKGSDWIAEVNSDHPCQTCPFGSCPFNQAVSGYKLKIRLEGRKILILGSGFPAEGFA